MPRPSPTVIVGQMRDIWFGILLIIKALAAVFLGILFLFGGPKFEIPRYSALPAFLAAAILFWLGWTALRTATRPRRPGA